MPSKHTIIALAVAMMMVSVAFTLLVTPVSAIDPLDPRVEITGDLGLAAEADSGSGTSSDPYIIEGRIINASSEQQVNGIGIADTRAHLVIRDCIVESGDTTVGSNYYQENGIYLDNCWNVTIENVTAERNSQSGIMLDNCRNVTIANSTCGLNGWNITYTQGAGISIKTCEDVTVSNCTIHENRWDGVNIFSEYDTENSANITLSGCAIWGMQHGIYDTTRPVDNLTVEGCVISDFLRSGIQINSIYERFAGLVLRDNIIENDNQMSDLGPIYLTDVTGGLIEGNLVRHTYSSSNNQIIYLTYCDNITVRDCTVIDNLQIPFQAFYCQNITFMDSLASNCTNSGVKIQRCLDVLVKNIEITGSDDDGIKIWDSMRVLVEGCHIHDNVGQGIYIQEDNNWLPDTRNIDIKNCTIARNYFGVDIYNNVNEINNVTVVGNSFIDNNATVYAYTDLQARDEGINNLWNDSSGGNYWSDWTGPDDDYDGFVDVPYDIYGSAGSQDMLPIADPEDIPPEVSITSPEDGATLPSGDVKVEWTAWDNQTDLDRIEVTVDSDEPVDVGLNTSMDLSLAEGGHTVTVTAYDAIGNDGSDSVSFTIDLPGTPGSPTGLEATPSDSAVSLEWVAPDDGGSAIDSYHVYRGTEPGSLVEVGTSTVTSYSDDGLTNGIAYHYAVSAENAIGEGEMSAVVNATPATVPAAPTSLSAEVDGTAVSLTWVAGDDGGSNIIYYNVYRSEDEGAMVLIGQSNGTGFTDAGLDYGVEYSYEVAAVNAVGEGAASDVISITLTTVPGAPVGLTVTSEDEELRLNWSAPEEDGGLDIDEYIVYRGTSAGSLSVLANTSATMFSDGAVVVGVVYYYAVSAVNAEGEGAMSAVVNDTLLSVPGTPMNVTVTQIDSTVVLSWDPPEEDGGSSILGYSIAYGNSSEDLDSSVNADGTEHTFSDLAGGNTYYFTVTAINDQGSGAASTMVNVTFVLVPSAPTDPDGTETDGGIQVSWSPPADDGGSAISSYNIYRAIGTSSFVLLTSVNDASYMDADLTNNTTYHYLIRAVNAEGEGPASLEISVDYQIDEPDDDDDGFDWYLLIIPIIVVMALLLIWMLWKRRKDEEGRQ